MMSSNWRIRISLDFESWTGLLAEDQAGARLVEGLWGDVVIGQLIHHWPRLVSTRYTDLYGIKVQYIYIYIYIYMMWMYSIYVYIYTFDADYTIYCMINRLTVLNDIYGICTYIYCVLYSIKYNMCLLLQNLIDSFHMSWLLVKKAGETSLAGTGHLHVDGQVHPRQRRWPRDLDLSLVRGFTNRTKTLVKFTYKL